MSYTFFLTRHIRSRRIRIAAFVVIILAVVVIDLEFSGDPALSIAILSVVSVIALVRLWVLGDQWPRRSDKQG